MSHFVTSEICRFLSKEKICMNSSVYVHFYVVYKMNMWQTMQLKSVFIILKLQFVSDGCGGELQFKSNKNVVCELRLSP
jgi:hypothetical protein